MFVHTFAHLGFDWAHLSGINIVWPLVDQFVTLDGELYYSSTEGVVQTFVDIAANPETGQQTVDAGQGGTTQNTHVSTPVQPSKDPDPGPVDRRFPLAVGGWQLFSNRATALHDEAAAFDTTDETERTAAESNPTTPAATDGGQYQQR